MKKFPIKSAHSCPLPPRSAYQLEVYDKMEARQTGWLAMASVMLLIVAIAIAMEVGFSTRAMAAKLMTESCVDCHVVHKWQDQTERKIASAKIYTSAIKGAGRVYTKSPGKLSLEKLALEEEDCQGCHASANSHVFTTTGLNTVPIVKNAKEPENPLAGGNFYYKSGQSHFEKVGSFCTSCHRDVRHHATKAGYRFLGEDIEGVGDPMYEHGDGHNIYQSGDQYCIACHPNFCGSENQKSEAGWVRHPTNTPLPMNGEYEEYAQRKDVPVSYPDPNKPERATARVMCMSCHRPHGTPYPYLLRWDYSAMVAGGEDDNETGCFACHTTKDTRK